MSSKATDLRPRPRGRPLSTAVERAVFDEVLSQIATSPPEVITRRAIATGSGVSRQTLYNRWATTADIVLDALLDRAARTIGVRDEPDLGKYLAELAAAVNGWARPGLRAIAAFAQSDRSFAQRFRTEFLEIRHGALIAHVEATTDDPARAARIAELIAGSMWYRLLIIDTELDREWIDEMISLTVATT